MSAERLAQSTLEMLQTYAINACNYAEAYGHNGRTLVIQGDMLSPSLRALPFGITAWGHSDTEFFSTWANIVGDASEDITVQCSDTDAQQHDPEYVWTLAWDEGNLYALHPDLDGVA